MKSSDIEEHIAYDSLQKQLDDVGIDTSTWGAGTNKTLADLQREIESGEAFLVTGVTGELLRKLVIGGADIYYQFPDGGKKYCLIEDRQVFKDGHERHRDLGHAVSEKMKPGEDPQAAMIRGIREELGIIGDIFLTETGTGIIKTPSPSYPGLVSQYIHYKFQAFLTDEQFDLEGYTEEQADKCTYFVWEEVI